MVLHAFYNCNKGILQPLDIRLKTLLQTTPHSFETQAMRFYNPSSPCIQLRMLSQHILIQVLLGTSSSRYQKPVELLPTPATILLNVLSFLLDPEKVLQP